MNNLYFLVRNLFLSYIILLFGNAIALTTPQMSESTSPLTEERQLIPTSSRDDIDQDEEEYDEIWEEIEEVEEEEETEERQELNRRDWEQRLTNKWAELLNDHNLTPEKQKKINDHFTDFFPGGIIENTLQSILGKKKWQFYEDELSAYYSLMEKRLQNIISLYEFSEVCKELLTELATSAFAVNVQKNEEVIKWYLLCARNAFLLSFVERKISTEEIRSLIPIVGEIRQLEAELAESREKIAKLEEEEGKLTGQKDLEDYKIRQLKKDIYYRELNVATLRKRFEVEKRKLKSEFAKSRERLEKEIEKLKLEWAESGEKIIKLEIAKLEKEKQNFNFKYENERNERFYELEIAKLEKEKLNFNFKYENERNERFYELEIEKSVKNLNESNKQLELSLKNTQDYGKAIVEIEKLIPAEKKTIKALELKYKPVVQSVKFGTIIQLIFQDLLYGAFEKVDQITVRYLSEISPKLSESLKTVAANYDHLEKIARIPLFNMSELMSRIVSYFVEDNRDKSEGESPVALALYSEMRSIESRERIIQSGDIAERYAVAPSSYGPLYKTVYPSNLFENITTTAHSNALTMTRIVEPNEPPNPSYIPTPNATATTQAPNMDSN